MLFWLVQIHWDTQIQELIMKSLKQLKRKYVESKLSEVFLAEKLISLHPWASKVKFARSGRSKCNCYSYSKATSGRDKVAICGYHGWHDWYLSANLKDKSKLNKHLLEGLHQGVPSKLKNTVIPFQYNDLNNLKKIVEKNKLGAIKMEVSKTKDLIIIFYKK